LRQNTALLVMTDSSKRDTIVLIADTLHVNNNGLFGLCLFPNCRSKPTSSNYVRMVDDPHTFLWDPPRQCNVKTHIMSHFKGQEIKPERLMDLFFVPPKGINYRDCVNFIKNNRVAYAKKDPWDFAK